MEFAGQPGRSGARNLSVPGLGSPDVDEDESDFVIGIRPKSSPLPRRRNSFPDDDSEPESPPSGSRRVSFADAKGLCLVQVKEFDLWDAEGDASEGDGKDAVEYFLSPLTFPLKLPAEELFVKVHGQKVELETIELLPGSSVLKGVICVHNISFDKAVYVRTTLDSWSSHFDLLAEYIPGSGDGWMDRFSFKLTLVPPFQEQGARVDFCLRFETPLGTFWANNNGKNYVLFCHQRPVSQQTTTDKENVNLKSCLKTSSQIISVENRWAPETSSRETASTDVSKDNEMADANKSFQTSDAQSGTLEEDENKLQMEGGQDRSRRSRRKAPRAARAPFGSQTDAALKDERRVKHPETEENQVERRSAAKALSEGDGDRDVLNVSSKTPSTGSETRPDLRRDGSRAQADESARDVDQAGETTTDSPTERQNISRDYCGDAVDATISPDSGEKQNRSVAFGTVVAPLYCQVFGRAGSPSRGSSDRGNPVKSLESPAWSCSAVPTGACNIDRKESNQRSLDDTSDPALPEKEESPDVPADIVQDAIVRSLGECANTPQSPLPHHQGGLPNAQTSRPGESRKDGVTFDPESRTDAEADQPTHLTETLGRSKTQTDAACQHISVWSLPRITSAENADDAGQSTASFESSNDSNVEDAGIDADIRSTSNVSPEEDKLYEVLIVKDGYYSAMKERPSPVSEIETGLVDRASDSAAKAGRPNNRQHGDAVSEPEGEAPLGKARPFETKATPSKHGELESAGTAAEKNWEMMVEEEEENLLTDSRERIEEKRGVLTGFEKEENEYGREIEEKEVTGTEKLEISEDGEGFEKESESVEETKMAGNDVCNGNDKDAQSGKTKGTGIQEEVEPRGEEEMEIRFKHEDETLKQVRSEREGGGEENPEREMRVDEAGEAEIAAAESAYAAAGGGGDEVGRSDERLEITPNKFEDGLAAPSSNVRESVDKRVIDKEKIVEGRADPIRAERHRYKTGDFQNNRDGTPDRADAAVTDCAAGERSSRVLTDEPESDRADASDESDSDDEVELYMRCLRAVHAGARASKDHGGEAAIVVSKRPAACRGKPLSTPMPSISESLDEDQHPCCLPDARQDIRAEDFKPAAAAGLAESSGQEDVSRWKETFSRSNVSKPLLYIASLLVFIVVAFHYDFLACFGLYLVSVVWLLCQGERQPVKNNRIG